MLAETETVDLHPEARLQWLRRTAGRRSGTRGRRREPLHRAPQEQRHHESRQPRCVHHFLPPGARSGAPSVQPPRRSSQQGSNPSLQTQHEPRSACRRSMSWSTPRMYGAASCTHDSLRTGMKRPRMQRPVEYNCLLPVGDGDRFN